MACGILVPWPGIEPGATAVKAPSPNHWTTREFPEQNIIMSITYRWKSWGPASHNYWAHVLQLLKPARLEPVLWNKRSHHNEKPVHRNEEQPPLAATRESPRSNEDPTQPKIK